MPRVADILSRKGATVFTIDRSRSVFEAIESMVDKGVGAMIITENGQPCGIFTERDYLRRIVLKGRTSRDTVVGDVMTERLVAVDPSEDLEKCMQVMSEARIRHIPVVDQGRLAGIVSIGDIVKHLSRDRQAEIRYLTDYIAGKYPA